MNIATSVVISATIYKCIKITRCTPSTYTMFQVKFIQLKNYMWGL